jgi:serine/threonine protein kinase
MIGQTFDHYRIESKLGEGGMGVVYAARDFHLDRAVAIKVLPANKVADSDRKRRFAQEAKAASALNHPNIVTIYDIRSQDDTDFIVMEYIEGRTVDKLIASKGLSTAQTLKYAVQMADALAKAHGAGILHRDLKPSNVMVMNDGRVKILDFGLAKLLDAGESALDGTSATLTMRELTKEGSIVGTAPYMSPEQAEGKALDARSDIFSFGALLYEMLTGRMAFSAESRLSTLAKVLNEDPPPPTQLGASISTELEKIVLRCLRKDPSRRYQTMADLKVALEDVEAGAGSDRQFRPGPFRLRWPWAALLPVLVVVGLCIWRVWPAPENTEPLRAVALATFPGQELYPSLSPDGNHVAFTWNGPKQDTFQIYVQQIGAGSPLRLTNDTSNHYHPVWSPDGRWIAFLRRESQSGKNELRLIAPLGGPERTVVETSLHEMLGTPGYLAWCPDSACVVVTDSLGEGKPDALFVVSIETGEKRQLTHPQPPVVGDRDPAVSPDGHWLVFRRNVTSGLTGELYLLSLGKALTASGEPRRLTTTALNAGHPAWMPDGKELLFAAGGGLWRVAIPGEKPPTRLPFVGEDGLMPVISRSQAGQPARLVYVRSFSDTNIWRIGTSGAGAPSSSPPTVAISSTRSDTNPQLSPDGRRVAFSSNRSGETEIWLSDLDGSNAVQLTTMRAPANGTPRWSPDGQSITFNCNPEGQWDIYTVPAAGGKPRRVTSHPANDAVPSFSHDGKWIYFNSNRTGEFQIWRIPATGGDAVQLTHNLGYVALESPDGDYLYYTQATATASALWRIPTSGGEPIKVLEGVIQRSFTVLKGGIYYLDQPASEVRLQYFDFASGRSTTVARNLGNVYIGLTASVDGRTILYTRVDSLINDLMLVENFR